MITNCIDATYFSDPNLDKYKRCIDKFINKYSNSVSLDDYNKDIYTYKNQPLTLYSEHLKQFIRDNISLCS